MIRMKIIVVQDHEIEVGDHLVHCKTVADMDRGTMETTVKIDGKMPAGIKARSTKRTDQAMKNHAELLGYAIMTAVDLEEGESDGN